MTTRRTLILAAVAAILVASAAVRLVRLDRPADYIFDEVYYAKDAKALLDDRIGPKRGISWMPGDEISWPHPYYGKLAIAAGIAVFGDDAFGWRFVPALAGIALLALVYPTALRLGLRREWALAAFILAAADLLGIAQSRIATLDIFLGLWTVLTVYLTLRAIQGRRRTVWLALAGVAAGLALGTKWSGLLASVAALALLLVLRRPAGGRRWWKPSWPDMRGALVAVGLLVVLPSALYVASYGVYFAAGHGLADWWHLQREMWTFNMNLEATHTYASLAPTWILDIRPVWYHFEEYAAQYYGVVAMGHPVLWWSAVIALVTLPVVALVDRDRDLAVPALLVALLYFPWFAASRTSFLYYMTPVAPFLAILVAAGLARLAGDGPRLQADGRLCDVQAAGPEPSAGDCALPDAPALTPSSEPASPADGGGKGSEAETHTDQAAGGPGWSLAAFFGCALVTALFWWPIARVVATVFYEWPARMAPAAGIAVATIAGVAALLGLSYLLTRPFLAGLWRPLAWGFVGVVVGLTFVFAPIVIDIPLPPDDFYRRIWLPTWL